MILLWVEGIPTSETGVGGGFCRGWVLLLRWLGRCERSPQTPCSPSDISSAPWHHQNRMSGQGFCCFQGTESFKYNLQQSNHKTKGTRYACLCLCVYICVYLCMCVYVHACSATEVMSDLFCNAMDGSPSGSSVHEILQARILEWVAISSSRGSSQTRDWTCGSCGLYRIGRKILYHWAT